ncbi:hypothetical protein DY000_02028604 [Brassica cretica]|uniref:Uncharacterized protein n=1 Tax=Brassica cretica TaxID=69181 RepID=A0ABQ7DR20_BRACR|nr:hypothetical protein DY000_02028604 [Brassica cretica]
MMIKRRKDVDGTFAAETIFYFAPMAIESLFRNVSLLKKRVNIGSGTPSRIKKLIDIEALGVSRLDMIVLDMHTDVKGFSLFTLPQVRDEFWDLYKTCFHQRVLEGNLRICLYGPMPAAPKLKNNNKQRQNQD